MKMTIAELAENYGTLDLLAAYIMRTVGVDEEEAEYMAYNIDYSLEQLLEERLCDEDDDEVSEESE